MAVIKFGIGFRVRFLAESVLAESVLAESVLAESVMAESVLAESVLAENSLKMSICRLTWLTWRTPFNLADLADLSTLLARSWIVLGTPPIASTPHLSHNCGQICDRNCDVNCDANVGPDQLHDMIPFRIRSTFYVHGYAQEHTIIYLKDSIGGLGSKSDFGT